ncbi:MAG: NAD(P)-binding protein [Fuerstiella sp.]|nr:NAD(P)-binding protein [Fuerstiella sp.]
MQFRVTGIRVPVEQSETELPTVIAGILQIPVEEMGQLRILRKSLDARQRSDLKFEYSVVVELDTEPRTASGVRIARWESQKFYDPDTGTRPMEQRPVIVGSGPAGLLAGYYLALRGFRPLIIERGPPVKSRVRANRKFDQGADHEAENNYLFGEGGAGCFSDGKLTCRVTGSDVDWVLERFVNCGGRASLVWEHRPHLGSNKLPMICRNFRRRIEDLGGEYRFNCRLEGLNIRDGQLTGLTTSCGTIETCHCILGIGHSARDTYQMLYRAGLPMIPKAFQAGLRIEHPQEAVNEHKYGKPEYLDILGAADYSLTARGSRDVFTFCMCAGGVIIPSVSEPEMFCSNGMSNSRHDTAFANSGLMVTISPDLFGSTHPLAGVELQRKYEHAAFVATGGKYLAPLQRVVDFLDDRTPSSAGHVRSSYVRGTKPYPLASFLPPSILSVVKRGLPIMNQKWRGRYLDDAVLTGPEMRGSSPVRMLRDRHTGQAPGFRGLYPVGEGAGYAGGIVTAAVDGLRAARLVVQEFSVPG